MFDKILGQKDVLERLKFAIEAVKVGGFCPFFLVLGPFGCGKTAIIRQFAIHLNKVSGGGKKYLEINCSTIKDVNAFVDLIHDKKMEEGNIISCFDECHNLPVDVQNLLLSVLTSDKDPVRKVAFKDRELTFDFSKHTFLFATTEPHKIFKPLKSRMEVLALEPYTEEELAQIIQTNAPQIKFSEGVLEVIVDSIKGTPRAASEIAKRLIEFCQVKRRSNFTSKELNEFRRVANVKLCGLDSIELSYLRTLSKKENQTASLTDMSATLGISSSALKGDHEHHLLKKGLMKINGQRILTLKGRNVLKLIDGLE